MESRRPTLSLTCQALPAQRSANNCWWLLTAIPLCSAKPESIFLAYPHAGNLLYDRHTGNVTLVDWALTENLSRDQRRHMALLLVMLALRDPVGICDEIKSSQSGEYRPRLAKGRGDSKCSHTVLGRSAAYPRLVLSRDYASPAKRRFARDSLSSSAHQVFQGAFYAKWHPERHRSDGLTHEFYYRQTAYPRVADNACDIPFSTLGDRLVAPTMARGTLWRPCIRRLAGKPTESLSGRSACSRQTFMWSLHLASNLQNGHFE